MRKQMSYTLQPRFHTDEGMTQQKPLPFSRIVYHFSTLRRNEPYSGGIGLIKSIVKPFLARGLNETLIFQSLLLDCLNFLRQPINLFNSIDKTKFPYYTLPPTQHYSFFGNLPPLFVWQTTGFLNAHWTVREIQIPSKPVARNLK